MKLFRSTRLLGLLGGFSGLVAALSLLDKDPLVGVLGTLGAMALLLGALATLCEGSSTE